LGIQRIQLHKTLSVGLPTERYGEN